jgi:hypothetical protein
MSAARKNSKTMRATGCSRNRASEIASRSPDFHHASVAHRIAEPDRTISLYRFFGTVQAQKLRKLTLNLDQLMRAVQRGPQLSMVIGDCGALASTGEEHSLRKTHRSQLFSLAVIPAREYALPGRLLADRLGHPRRSSAHSVLEGHQLREDRCYQS